MTPEEAIHSDDKLIVVTYSLIRRREIAASYCEVFLNGPRGRWFNSYWFRLLDRIILAEQVEALPEPKPPLFYDEEQK